MTPIDIGRVRSDTPAVSGLVHFNNAGASLSPTPVVNTTIKYLQLEAAIGGYEAFDQESAAFARFYDSAAALLGCSTDEVSFSTSAGDAWWRAFCSVPLAPGDRILASKAEYTANMYGLIQARSRGIEVVLIENDASGTIDLVQLEEELQKGASLVAITQISMASGGINPVAAVGRLAKAHGAIYLLDACQAAGQLTLDVEAIGCDFLLFTGRKWLRGPRGTGLLYTRATVMDSLLDPIFVDGRSAEWTSLWEYEPRPTALRYEMGEVSFASKLGLGEAMAYALNLGLDAIEQRVQLLANQLRAQLGDVPGVEVRDRGNQLSGICTFTVDGKPAMSLTPELRSRGFNTSAVSKEISRIDLDERGIDAVVRASIHYYNTEDEIDRFISVLRQLV